MNVKKIDNKKEEEKQCVSGAWKTHLLLLQPLLGRVDVLLHCHVDELVLGLGLHHARALLPHQLDGLRDVDVAIQTWSTDHNTAMSEKWKSSKVVLILGLLRRWDLKTLISPESVL